MRRGTTPVIVLNTDLDLSQVAKLYVTFQQEGITVVEKDETEVEIDGSQVIISLSQEDTLEFHLDPRDTVYIQIRIRFENGTAMASNVLKVRVKEILKEGVI